MNFRNIDIDAIENEFYNDQDLAEVDDRNPEETTAHFNSLQSHSTSLLNSHQTSQALALLLDSPPFGPTQNSAKSINTNSIIQILSSTRTNDIEGALKDLQPHHHDNLMKYIYKSMSLPIADSSGNVFLSWHEKLTQVAGTGSIVRVMTDRRLI
ncbi:Actin-related protein 2/3 complex subunit 5 [Wallemia ichthyophaga EXF-994]|uniref:Actin-related protein 2/3 complex subunit 5 n=1 Tax=Wallemia ichthyophaga (strain EXF-994 / CBS 113033) TaxID=1299270 RepID=R9AV46_WALI9|nr:Actin-related protein 2/3 complex subunit 5 [Wallemia ichthyophaga EXF-994]EOR03971.1 Actin-related protein 2/3 complex subunit 5 [Wallemia ichthyophaga EXF-994]